MRQVAQLRLKEASPRFGLFLLDHEADVLERMLLRALREAEGEERRSLCQRLLDKLQPYSFLPLNDEELGLLKRLLKELKAELRVLILKDDSLERRRHWRQLHRLCEDLLEQVKWVERPPGPLPDFRYRQLSLGEFIPGIPDRPSPRWRQRPRKLTPEEEERLQVLRALIQTVARWLTGMEEMRDEANS